MMPSLLKFLRTNFITMLWLIVAGFVMSWFIWRGCCTQISSYVWISFFTASLWIALWLGNAYVSQALDNFFSWHKEPVRRLVAGLIGMTLYTVGAVYGIVFVFRYGFGFSVGDQLDGTYLTTIIITLIITMFMTGREFLVNWRQAAVDAERLKKESVEAQYNSLRNQVNPHFLFNSLNALTNLVYQNQEQAVKFIKQLSEVYRYVLDTRNREVVALAEEIKFLDSYIFLQKIRFGNKLEIDVKLGGVSSMVAPLALQMLVENAIKHNVIAEEHPLLVKVYEQPGYLVVENNLQRKAILDEDSSGLGLENIKKRYEFLSDKSVEVTENNSSFIVKLPILEK